MKLLREAFVILLALLPQAARLQPVDWTAEAARLEMHRQLWNTHNIDRYEYLLDMDCFCVQNSPVRVTVENGRITSLVDAHTGI